MTSKRDAVVAGAAAMISRQGVGAVSVRELATFTGSPVGSTYHHFPNGKQQIIDEAIGWTREGIVSTIESAGSPRDVLARLARSWRRQLQVHDFQVSCPVLSVATSQGETSTADAAFARWHEVLTRALAEHEVEDASALAWTLLASIEGAVVLSRSQRSLAPLDAVTAHLTGLLPA